MMVRRGRPNAGGRGGGGGVGVCLESGNTRRQHDRVLQQRDAALRPQRRSDSGQAYSRGRSFVEERRHEQPCSALEA